jgi:hypothetical protein
LDCPGLGGAKFPQVSARKEKVPIRGIDFTKEADRVLVALGIPPNLETLLFSPEHLIDPPLTTYCYGFHVCPPVRLREA